MEDAPYRNIGRRLEKAIHASGMTRKEIAAALEQRGKSAGPSAISQWLKGHRRPDREKIVLLADILGVHPEWLERGTRTFAPRFPGEKQAAYQKQLAWVFRSAPADGGRDYGNANIWSFRPGIGTLVREALQNVLDEVLDSTVGASVTFRLIRLSGADLNNYLRALCWESQDTALGLRAHLEAAAPAGLPEQVSTKLARVLRDGLSALERNQELNLLVIEDRRTRGLVGEETGNGNFAALVRNNLDTHKVTATAGGSFGLGKAVFPLCSRFAVTFYHSCLHDTPPYVRDAKGRKMLEGRVIGKADLLWHRDSLGQEWAGPGWFGEPTGRPGTPEHSAKSVWESDALIDDLYLTRRDDEMAGAGNGMKDSQTGTSIAIMGFYDPSGEVPSDIQQLGSRIAEETARSFWPALVSGRLEACVALYEGREQRSVLRVDAETFEPAFVDAYRRRNKGVSRPDKPGDIATARVLLRTPAAKDSRQRPETHEAQLIVRLDTSEDRHSDLTGTLALLRGSGMVVAYKPVRQHMVTGAPAFHAVLACGEAAGDAPSDTAAERFLRVAEPPAHDRWESNPDMTALYVRGGGRAIQEFLFDAVTQIREMLRPKQDEFGTGPRTLLDLMRIPGPEAGASPTASAPFVFPRLIRTKGRLDARGHWDIEAEIRLPDAQEWRVTPVLLFDADSGGPLRVAWSHLEAAEGCRAEGSTLVLSSPRQRARFRGVSDPTSHPVPADQAAILVELRDPRPTAREGAAG